jgi:hypothetical protein
MTYAEFLAFYEFLDGAEPTPEMWEDWIVFQMYLDMIQPADGDQS